MARIRKMQQKRQVNCYSLQLLSRRMFSAAYEIQTVTCLVEVQLADCSIQPDRMYTVYAEQHKKISHCCPYLCQMLTELSGRTNGRYSVVSVCRLYVLWLSQDPNRVARPLLCGTNLDPL